MKNLCIIQIKMSIRKFADINGFTRHLTSEETPELYELHLFRNPEKECFLYFRINKGIKENVTLFISKIEEIMASGNNLKKCLFITEKLGGHANTEYKTAKDLYFGMGIVIVTMTYSNLIKATAGNIFVPEVVTIIRKSDKMEYEGEELTKDILHNATTLKQTDQQAKLYLMSKGDVIVTKQRYGTKDSIAENRLHIRVYK